jgi:hypothetical protein
MYRTLYLLICLNSPHCHYRPRYRLRNMDFLHTVGISQDFLLRYHCHIPKRAQGILSGLHCLQFRNHIPYLHIRQDHILNTRLYFIKDVNADDVLIVRTSRAQIIVLNLRSKGNGPFHDSYIRNPPLRILNIDYDFLPKRLMIIASH